MNEVEIEAAVTASATRIWIAFATSGHRRNGRGGADLLAVEAARFQRNIRFENVTGRVPGLDGGVLVYEHRGAEGFASPPAVNFSRSDGRMRFSAQSWTY